MKLALWLLLLQIPNLPIQITHDGNVGSSPALSPDGKLLAYPLDSRNGEGMSLWLHDVEARKERKLQAAGGLEGSLVFSPDGKSVYFTRHDQKRPNINLLMEWPIDNSSPPKMKVEDVDSAVSFSPDGKSFAFERDAPGKGRSLIVATFPSGKERELGHWQVNEPRPQEPAWSPDGKEIAVATRGAKSKIIFILASGKGEPRELPVAGGVGGIAWSRAGLYALLGRNSPEGTLQIWRLDVASSQWTQITKDEAGYQNLRISVTPDGALLAAVRYQMGKTGMDDLLAWAGAKVKPRINPNVVLIRPSK